MNHVSFRAVIFYFQHWDTQIEQALGGLFCRFISKR